jgi:hypothetical protein
MKSIISLFALFAFSIFINAQSTDLDRETFYVSYVRLPTNPVEDESLRTYSIQINSSPMAESAYPSKLLHENITLEGFEKINKNGTIDILLQINDVIITGIKYYESEEVKKDKEGNVISSQKYFKPIIDYKTTASYYIKDQNGARVEYPISDKDQFKGYKYKTKKEAEKYVSTNLKSLKLGFLKSFIASIPSSINYTINNQFGYDTQKQVGVNLWILDSKKHPEFEGHKKALKQIQDVFATTKYNEPITGLKEKLDPVITYFESVIPKYTDAKKNKHKKMRYASYYNLAKIYYYIDMPDETIKYANMLVENNYDKEDGRQMAELATSLNEKFIVNKTKTRHFEVITTDVSFDETIVETPVVVEVAPVEEQLDTAYMSSGSIEEDNKVSTSILRILKNVFAARGNSLGDYPIGAEYITDNASGKIIGQKLLVPNNAKAYKYIHFVWDGNFLTHALIDTNRVDLYWKNNQLIGINVDIFGTFNFTIHYDINNNPVYLEGHEANNNGIPNTIDVVYKDNRIIESKINAQTPYKKYISKVKTFSYNDDVVEVNTIIYKKGKNPEPKNIVSNLTMTYRVIAENELQITTHFLMSESKNIKNFRYRLNDGLMTRVSNLNEPGNSRNTTDHVYEGDKLVKTFHFATYKGKFQTKWVSNSKDFIKKPGQTEDKWRHGKYFYDENDVLIKEFRDRKYHEKIDGVWSGWKFMRY